MAMKTLILVALALLCVSLSFVPTRAEEESAVVVLDDLNFDEQTATGEWLVEFYAPWCGHCKNLAPTWEKLAAQADPARLRVGKVDCTQNKGICSRFQVKGFPTIKFLKERQVYGFKGSRTVDDFVSFTQAGYKAAESFAFPTPVVQAEPVLAGAASGAGGHVQVLTADNFTVVNNGDRWFVMFYAPWCGHCKNLAPTWEKAAAEFAGKVHMAKLDCTTNTFICQLFEVKGYPTLKYFKGDGTIRSYSGQREVSDFDEFVKKGHQMVAAESLPVPAFLMHPVVFQVLKAFEPVAEWINVNLGATFGIVALLAFIFGFLLGRISADGRPSETRYVIPKELGPQLNELIAKKNANEEKRRAKREAREQRKKKSVGEAAAQEAISLVTSNELNTSSPRKRRNSKPRN